MSSKEKEKSQKSTKNVNSTLNSNPKDKGKQSTAKSSTKRTLEDYAFPVETFKGIASKMSKLKPLTLT